MNRGERDLAYVRLSGLAWEACRLRHDPVAKADMDTSLADARAAFGLALGEDIDHIDPDSGLHCGPNAYRLFLAERARRGADHDEWFAQTKARWVERFPAVVAQVEAELEAGR